MTSDSERVDDWPAAALPASGSPAKAGGGRRWRWLFIAKFAASVVLLAWILSRAGLAEILATVRSADPSLLLAGYALYFCASILPVFRWRLLLRAQGTVLSRVFLLKSYMVAAFFNNVLPSTVGGDASRAYDCYRGSGGNHLAMSSVVVDRLLGLLALVVLALLALHFATRLSVGLPDLPLWLGLAGVGVGGVIGAIFFGPRRPFGLTPSAPPGSWRQKLASVASAFDLYRGRWRTLLAAFALSFLIQCSGVLFFILIAQSLGLGVPLLDFCVIVPLLMFVIMLPISINGIGLRENALAVILGFYGVAPAEAVALAWLDYAGGLLFGLMGGAIYALRR